MPPRQLISLDGTPLPAAFWVNSGERPLLFASSLGGLQQSRLDPQGSLVFVVTSFSQLQQCHEIARSQGAQFLFHLKEIPPRLISQLGDFDGPLDLEVPDSRCQRAEDLDPPFQVLQRSSFPAPENSVIIPTYNNPLRTRISLKQWFRSLSAETEIVLVDDGSNDPWMDELRGTEPERLTLLRRQRNGSWFRRPLCRAGTARNLGAQFAKGHRLFFCDSDMIVPSSTFHALLEGLKHHDVVMPLRWQLPPRISLENQNVEDLDPSLDTILSPGAHWEHFQSLCQDWSSLSARWRWVSSFCLGMKRSTWERVGPFRRGYVTYGFEDTDWGYRAFLHGLGFGLISSPTYHQHQPQNTSQYGSDLRKKTKALSIAADRFFRYHPRKDVYLELREWLR